ncbi:hypothetical protein AAFF_G00036380 [Aldrovandia affinis]|uniref:Uncharacterized protein n=1 Tax=Aldrovandia affinis TaxID=143900 RepID=A0AAD7S3M8_9TELE|nr:hypothetical protein AAFF_G00036380 [Aldrovandia affinis]
MSGVLLLRSPDAKPDLCHEAVRSVPMLLCPVYYGKDAVSHHVFPFGLMPPPEYREVPPLKVLSSTCRVMNGDEEHLAQLPQEVTSAGVLSTRSTPRSLHPLFHSPTYPTATPIRGGSQQESVLFISQL